MVLVGARAATASRVVDRQALVRGQGDGTQVGHRAPLHLLVQARQGALQNNHHG